MSINRIHRSDKFVQVPNELARDANLSFKARGILVFMLSHIDGWKADYRVIAASGREGREAIRSGLSELDALGYRVVVRERKPDGKFNTVVHWFDTPGHKEPGYGNPVPGQPDRNRRPSKKTMKKTTAPSSSLRDSSVAYDPATDGMDW